MSAPELVEPRPTDSKPQEQIARARFQRIVILGPPGSGKGTQAARITETFGLPTASTGAILREQAAEKTPRGREISDLLATGVLFPDELMTDLVKDWVMMRGERGFVLDGFPRTLPQAEMLDGILTPNGADLQLALHLEVREEVLLDRIERRVSCQGCASLFQIGKTVESREVPCPHCGGDLAQRSDDDHAVLRTRLHEYQEKTAPLLPHYRKLGILQEVGGEGSPDSVFQAIRHIIEA